VLPQPNELMRRFGKLLSLLDSGSDSGTNTDTEYSKSVPIIRKLATESKIQRKIKEITARLRERL